MKYLSWIILLPLALALIIFGVSNRASVPIDLWPIPYQIDIPLFALLFGALLTGVLWGGVATWMRAGRKRRDSRQVTRDLRSLNLDNQHLKKEIEALKADAKARDEAPDQLLKIESSRS